MYNKLFTKILDSSIWLESTPTRIVWLTFIAVMDDLGFAAFASVANVAHRARVTKEEAVAAVACLESPDESSSDPDNSGRRLERVPGGWIVLNADKHRKMVTKAIIQEQTRERVRKFRLKRTSNAPVTGLQKKEKKGIQRKERKLSEAIAEAIAEVRPLPLKPPEDGFFFDEKFTEFENEYPKTGRGGGDLARRAFVRAIGEVRRLETYSKLREALTQHKRSEKWSKGFIPSLLNWLERELWKQELPELEVPDRKAEMVRNYEALAELDRRKAEARK